MKQGNALLVSLVVAALVVGAVFVLSNRNTSVAPDKVPAPTQVPAEIVTNQKEASDTVNVSIKNFAFSPATVTIKKGQTITWTNEDSVGHTATALDDSFDTGMLQNGDSGSHTFSQVGSFDYKCTPHPNMKGKIIVQ